MAAKTAKYFIACFILVTCLLLGISYSSDHNSSRLPVRPYKNKGAMPGELLVKFKGVPGTGSSSLTTASNDNSSKILSRAKIKKLFSQEKGRKAVTASLNVNTIDQPGVYKLKFNKKEDLYTIEKQLLMDPAVEYVEQNYIIPVCAVPNDPQYQYQWGLQKIGASPAWDVQKGDSTVVIAVIDTGVDYTHPDLVANIWRNTDEILGNGIDDDHNGYVDDDRGWDFIDLPQGWVWSGEDGMTADNDPSDYFGHGTHVAGIASGVTNNGIGGAGTSWNSKIMCLRAGYKGWDGGGYMDLASAVESIYYAADNGADIINMSWGMFYDPLFLNDAVAYAHNKGCVMVAATGNVYPADAQKLFFPAACADVIAVSATDGEDKIAIWSIDTFSNFGSFVDICAPGTNIISSIPGNSYSPENGTSMAAPFVSGAAALVRSKYPSWTPEQVEQHIKESSDDITAANSAFLAGKLGSGRVNIQKAMGNLKMAITYPRSNSILSGSTIVKGSANMEHFKEYKVEASNNSSPSVWQQVGEVHSQPVEDGLLEVWHMADPDSQYYLRLTVTNTSGESFSSIAWINTGINGECALTGPAKSGPNPYDPNAGQYLFYYVLQNASATEIMVLDITGTMIWKRDCPYDAGSLGIGGSVGENRVWWDGTDGFGRKIANGAYLYLIVAKDGGVRKIIGRGKIAVVR